jgi:hypothetical protein
MVEGGAGRFGRSGRHICLARVRVLVREKVD